MASIHGEIRARILHLQLPPGAAFTEAAVAEELGCGKAPVREALARLRREGLVESSPRSGYRVVPLTVKDANDLFALRVLLEGESAAQAATQPGDPALLLELDGLARCRDEGQEGEGDALLARNTGFHLAVARLAGNARLVEALRKVYGQLDRYLQLALWLHAPAGQLTHEHGGLLAAILEGDAAAARRIAVEQAEQSRRFVLDALLSAEPVQSANLGGHLVARR